MIVVYYHIQSDMDDSTVNILDLSDEMLLTILNKLNNINVLHSLLGVNRKFDRLVQNVNFIRSLDFTAISSNEDDCLKIHSMLKRFCFDIIPRIQHKIQCLTLDSWSMNSVLCIGDYPTLRKLTLVNLKVEMAGRLFLSKLFGLIILQININSHIDLYISSRFIICFHLATSDF